MIPVIDLQTHDVLDRIDEAYSSVGFAVFTNAISPIENVAMNIWFEEMKEFFKQHISEKNKYKYQSKNNLGYSMIGDENVDPTAPKDLKESFNFDNNRMPEELWPDINAFKESALDSIEVANKLTLNLLEKFDTILDAGTTLVDAHKKGYNTTRVLHYPAVQGKVENRQLRIGEHSDYGTITLLWQINDVPGLQVQDLKGEWHPVPYADEGVVVNIADLLQRWTNDYFKSTKHRVINSHIDQERYSMAHFVDPIPGTIVSNLRNEPSKYDPIESLEYLRWRLTQSY